MENEVKTTGKQTGKVWVDEAGNKISASRITPSEKAMETEANRIYELAVKAEKRLKDLKDNIEKTAEVLMDQFYKENNIDVNKRKGNFTIYSFNRAIKIEVSVQDKQTFDSNLIEGCKEKLMQFLDTSISSTEDFVKQIVLDAFETTKGNMDVKKVMSLLKYKSRIKSNLYQEAMVLLERAIRVDSSKTYQRVYKKNEAGEYVNVNLNFSAL